MWWTVISESGGIELIGKYRTHLADVLIVAEDLVKTLDVERADGVVAITLNRPDKKNAINGGMWRELVDAFREIEDTPEDRVLVITGAGDAFCSGADLTDSDSAGDVVGGVGGSLRQMRIVGRAALALHSLPIPTIAAVNGVAAGAGCNLALGCDLVVASERARFSEIFSKRGLSLDFGGSWILPRLVGMHRAKELAFLADIIDASEAERIGLVNRVVAHDQLGSVVAELAGRLAALPPIQVAVTKKLLNQSFSVSMAEALEFEDVAQVMNFQSADTREAIVAFVTKREPRFTGS
ncbi:MAG: enoyl-CoA hydratase [Acidimicrobiia bacterium]|nr:enoyl-CoA hydratase [Acidimicrobiia bacterium]